MCTVSMIGDHYGDKFRSLPTQPWQPGTLQIHKDHSQEIAELRRDIEEMKALLRRALKYDEASGQPECGNDDKIAFLRKVAESVGLSLDDVFKPTPKKRRAQRKPA